MIYKYLFYSVSYIVKKYDSFWKVGETYYVGGGMMVGMVVSLSIVNILDVSAALLHNERFILIYPSVKYLPLILGLAVTVYLGVGKRHEKIYTEVEQLGKYKKTLYKILNIIHLIIVFGLFFNMTPILKFFNLI
jgi:hypothetical protein